MTSRGSVVALVAVLSAVLPACSESTLAGPPSSPSAPVVPAAPTFPALTKPGTVYLAPDSIYRQRQGYPGDLPSRFVLYGDGTFALQFAGFGEYPGRYTRADGDA